MCHTTDSALRPKKNSVNSPELLEKNTYHQKLATIATRSETAKPLSSFHLRCMRTNKASATGMNIETSLVRKARPSATPAIQYLFLKKRSRNSIARARVTDSDLISESIILAAGITAITKAAASPVYSSNQSRPHRKTINTSTRAAIIESISSAIETPKRPDPVTHE